MPEQSPQASSWTLWAIDFPARFCQLISDHVFRSRRLKTEGWINRVLLDREWEWCLHNMHISPRDSDTWKSWHDAVSYQAMELNQGMHLKKIINCIHEIQCCITCRFFFLLLLLLYGLAYSCHKYETQDSIIKCYASHLLPNAAPIQEQLDSFAKNKSIFQKSLPSSTTNQDRNSL